MVLSCLACFIRYDFMAGKVDKYHWVDIGSSYVPSELSCAVLWAQLQQAHELTQKRVENFNFYVSKLLRLQDKGLLRISSVPDQSTTNGHIFFVVLPTQDVREKLEVALKQRGISAFSHYVPLHSSPAGLKYCKVHPSPTSSSSTSSAFEPLPVTQAVFAGLLRLPIWAGLTAHQLDSVADAVISLVDVN